MLVDDAGNVWLTEFGIASQLRCESQAPAPPEIIAGTLAYIAAEQTGRIPAGRKIHLKNEIGNAIVIYVHTPVEHLSLGRQLASLNEAGWRPMACK